MGKKKTLRPSGKRIQLRLFTESKPMREKRGWGGGLRTWGRGGGRRGGRSPCEIDPVYTI